MINVIEILNRYNIGYVDQGNNVAKGNVNIQCPWCGASDHSQHLGINLESGMWGCWRSTKHRGRKFSQLLSKLTGLSLVECRRIVGEGGLRAIQQGDMERAVQALSEDATAHAVSDSQRSITLPDEFRRICVPKTVAYRAEMQFRNYLKKERGFPNHHHRPVARLYDLHYCVTGRFADRLIIPVYENGELMTYLGRSLYSDAALRYLALDKELSVKQVKDCLYNYDEAAKGGKTLFIVEGAFDAMKIDFYSKRKEVRAVGLFNMNIEAAQQELFDSLFWKFDKFIIMLDEGQVSQSLDLQARLKPVLGNVLVWFMKDEWGVKDPADLSPSQVRKLDGRI